jgi:hypothetical protein
VSTRCSLFLAVLVLLAGASAFAEPKVAKPTTQPSEPPLEFTLHINGQAIAIEVNAPRTVTVGGKDVTVKLTPKPDRLLQLPGFSFRYPSQHGYEHESEAEYQQWTLDGNDNVIIVTRVPRKLEPAALVGETLDGIAKEFGRANVKRSKGELALGGKKYPSTHLHVSVLGQKLSYQAVGINVGESTVVLIVQDSAADDGSLSAETKTVLDLLDKTFKIDP